MLASLTNQAKHLCIAELNDKQSKKLIYLLFQLDQLERFNTENQDMKYAHESANIADTISAIES